MVKTVQIGGKEVRMRVSAAVPLLYRNTFKSDLFIDLMALGKGNEELAIMERLAYIMAKHADASIPDDIVEWLSGFKVADIYNASLDILKTWEEDVKTEVKGAKKLP